MAHAYLELSRVWEANVEGMWLYEGISSAGCCVENENAMEDNPVVMKALNKLIPRGEYSWGQGPPWEPYSVVARMRTLKRRQVTLEDLEHYDILLCFSAADHDHIRNIKIGQPSGSKGLARVVILPHCEELSSIDYCKNPVKLDDMIAKVKTGIREFISVELCNWPRAMNVTKHNRTRQEIRDGPSLNTYIADKVFEGPKVPEIEEQTGCIISIQRTRPLTRQVLLSISGPEEAVMEA